MKLVQEVVHLMNEYITCLLYMQEDEIIIEISPKRKKSVSQQCRLSLFENQVLQQDHVLEVTTKARVTVNPREEKKAKSSSPVESTHATRKKTKSPEIEITSPVKKPTTGLLCVCVLVHLCLCVCVLACYCYYF